MTHPLVAQLRFTRSEWLRGLTGLTDDDGARRFGAMNSLGWLVGHLANHEQRYWLLNGEGRILIPEVRACAPHQPATTPPLSAMVAAWRAIVAASEPYLDALTPQLLATHWQTNGTPAPESIGTSCHRITFHYWFHLGEVQAIRQLLGQADLPAYVGDLASAAYHPTTGY